MSEKQETGLKKLIDILHRERGIDFRGYKTTSLGRRIERRLEATKCEGIDCYIDLVNKRPDELNKLIDTILINVTEFFRDPEAWQALREVALPQIMAGKRPGDQIRIWSAGCASGEEPYSLAIAIAEYLGPRVADYDVRVYATDVDEPALAAGRRGEYEADAVKNIPTEVLQKYFTRNARWTVSRDIRRMVIYGKHNLVSDAPISHADLISCRNVLIYMSVDLQNRILSKFHYGLNPSGFLFLGKAESLLMASRLYFPANDRWRIFQKQAQITVSEIGRLDQHRVGQAAQTSADEYQSMSDFNESVLRYAPSGLIALDDQQVVRVVNPPAETMWGIRAAELLGRPIAGASISSELADVLPRLAQVKSQRAEIRIEEIDLSNARGKPLHISVTLSPIFNVRGRASGMVIVAENITNQVRLRNELEALNEQMQATNEELETTNEELQSTNEELETTNEELQSTNEELETTNEELQSTNEELATTNDELSVRTMEFGSLSLYYSSVLNSLDVPVVVLDGKNVVTTWNPAAELFYGLKNTEAIGHDYFEMNLPVKVVRTRDKLLRLRETRNTFRSKPIDYKTRTGDTKQVTIEYQPLIDAQGEYQGVVSIVRDVDFQPIEPAARG